MLIRRDSLQKFYLLIPLLVLSACSVHTPIQDVNSMEASPKHELSVVETLSDLENIPQISSVYSKGIAKEARNIDDFLKDFFRVWNIEKISVDLKDAMWSYDAFRYGECYGENLQLLSEDFFTNALDNSNFENYASLNKKALSLKLLDIRAFPTSKPVLRDPSKAGEGFPFDYMQNSTIAPNKPLLVSHYSKDREWVFVESSFAFGWVKASDITFIDKKYTDIWQKAHQVFLIKDNISIYSESGNFLFNSRVGMLLPLIEEDSDSYTVLTVTRDESFQAFYQRSIISKEYAHKGTLSFNEKNINIILEELYQSHYGWGGMYAERDCSSTLRDFYAPFGLWLPRNSYMQAQKGTTISLEGLDDTEKLKRIKEFAIPFETLLYKQGHIVLYVGHYEGKVVVFQNVWGVKTKKDDKEGRFIVGRAIFSTLELGKNLEEYDQEGSLLRNLKSLNLPLQ